MPIAVWIDEPKVATAFGSNEWETDWIRHGSANEIDGWQWSHSWSEIIADIIDALYGDHGDPGTVYATTQLRALEYTVSQGITVTYELLMDRMNSPSGLTVRLESSEGVVLASADCSSGDDIGYRDEEWSPTETRTYDTVLRGVLHMLEDEFKCVAQAFGF